MGRFDSLIQLEQKPEKPTPLPQQDDAKGTGQQFASKLVNQPGSLLAKKQTSKEDSKQTSRLADSQTSQEVNQPGSKLLKKFGSYLPPETIKALKRYAFENDREVYDVLKEAIDLYLAQHTWYLLAS